MQKTVTFEVSNQASLMHKEDPFFFSAHPTASNYQKISPMVLSQDLQLEKMEGEFSGKTRNSLSCKLTVEIGFRISSLQIHSMYSC